MLVTNVPLIEGAYFDLMRAERSKKVCIAAARSLSALMMAATLAVNPSGGLAEDVPGHSEPVKVNTKGVKAVIRYEAVVDGFLSEINGKYKLRVTEITIDPGGVVGDHNHLGPGIRQMTEGKMQYILPEKSVTYGPGDFFFEAGNVSHHVENRWDVPCTHLLFEILPINVKGPSLIPPRDVARH